MQAKDQYGKMK